MIGILGGGQLGRMLALAGYPLGLRCRFLDPSSTAPAGQLAELLDGSFEDPELLDRFARGLDVVTYEFENVPVTSARWLAQRLPVFPPPDILEVAQDRLNEKSLFRQLGIPTPSFAPVDSRSDLRDALHALGTPAILKTRRFGYDGKGQFVVPDLDALDAAWNSLGGVPLILEQFVPFQREVSLISVRHRAGHSAFYPLVENHHRHGILRTTFAPAPGCSTELQRAAEDHAKKLLEFSHYVGVLAVEFFERDGVLLANEIAPRVHNSGHWTIEGSQVSQFENHLRAILGLPLGSTRILAPCAMFNLVGSVPTLDKLLSIDGLHVHLYGKEPRTHRKLGHLTITGAVPDDPRVSLVRELLDS